MFLNCVLSVNYYRAKSRSGLVAFKVLPAACSLKDYQLLLTGQKKQR
jgi:hypothetical protein